MSKGQNKSKRFSEIAISDMLSPNVSMHKSIIINFLSEIYSTIFKRCNRVFNSYTFQEFTNLPMLISDKIYNQITNYEKSLISLSQFTNGIYSLLYDDIYKKFSITFHILDFDNNSIINKSDVFLILSHFHLIENPDMMLPLLENIIDNFFDEEEIMSYEQYITKSTSSNCDVPLLIIIFINNYLQLFTKKEIVLYQKILKFNPNKERKKESSIMLSHFPHSSKFIEYLENVNFNNKKKCVKTYMTSSKKDTSDEESESDLDSIILTDSEDEKDFDDLDNFEKDLGNAFTTIKQNIVMIKTKRTFSPSKIPSLNLLIQKEMKGTHSDKNVLKIPGGLSSMNEDSSNNFLKMTTKGSTFSSSYRSNNFSKSSTKVVLKTKLSFSPSTLNTKYNRIKSLKYCHDSHNTKILFLFKAKEDMKTEKFVKLVLVNKFIFYFIKNGNKFNFKHIIPIFSLFPKKTFINQRNIVLSLISTVHNYTFSYSFIGENEKEIDDFIYEINLKNESFPIGEDFRIGHEIGKGKFGHVMLAKSTKISIDHKFNNFESIYAIKMINKGESDEEYKINQWEKSIFSIFRNVNNPHIMKCYAKYESVQHIYFVYEFIEGSDLKTFISNQAESHKKANIIEIAVQILRSVSFIHKLGIIHRDIKTTNIMVDINHTVKLIDFGLSRVLGKEEYSTDPYGSLCFKAPELLKQKPYNFCVDIWAVGVTLYYMVFKKLPFEEGTRNEIKKSIMNDNVTFPINELYYNSSNGTAFMVALIGECLERKIENRATIGRLMEKYTEKFNEDEDDYFI